MSFDAGGGSLSQSVLTTNALGVGTITFTSNSNTLSSNTIRAEDTIVRAYGTVVVTQSGVVPVGGSVSSATNSSITNTGTLTLSGYTGTISKWQRSIDGGSTWTDVSNTSATYTYTNQPDGTQYRAIISGGTCTAYSQPGLITVTFSYSGYVFNSENIGLSGIPVNFYYKLKGQTSYTLYGSSTTDFSGKYNLTTTLPVNSYDFRVSVENLTVSAPSTTDAKNFNMKIFSRSFNARDYYRMDTNGNNALTITDVYLIYFKSTWPNSTPTYRVFGTTDWAFINSSTTNLKTTYPGIQTMNIDGIVSESSTNFYIVRTGYFQ
jgi:hypothetical protein